MSSAAVALNRYEGLVVPSSWDDRGWPLGVTLLTDDEGEHSLAGAEAAHELMRCMHKRVRVFGRMEADSRGNRYLIAERFEVISP